MIRFGIQQPKYDHDRLYSSKNELSNYLRNSADFTISVGDCLELSTYLEWEVS